MKLQGDFPKISRYQAVKRLIEIIRVCHRFGLDELLVFVGLAHYRRWFTYTRWMWGRAENLSRGARLRVALETLGPIFIKFGQLLSTRLDILPDDVADELIKLQDRVPPFDSQLAVARLEKTYGAPLSEVFLRFDETPLSSASIAQVHAATLKTGEEVVVKVLRPDLAFLIARDLALLKKLARFIEGFWPDSRRFHPIALVKEFETTLIQELDLMREAASASQLKRNFHGAQELYVPTVYWPYCRENVLVIERVFGIPIGDVATLKQLGVDFKKLAERGVQIFFTQVFRDCFFHADMHPGNVFVNVIDPKNPQYMAIDFGIMGSLSPSDQRYLAGNFLGFFRRDYRQVALLHVESGWIPRNTRIDAFEAAIRTVCEPIFERPLRDISVGQTLLRLFQTARQFDMEVQPQLLLLQKTLVAVEGLGRQLYPDLDLWHTAKPFLEKWMRQQVGVRGLIREIRLRAPHLIHEMPDLPRLMHASMLLYVNEKDAKQREVEKPKSKWKRISRFILVGVIFMQAALIFVLVSGQ